MTEDEAKQKWCPFVRYTAPSEIYNDWEWNRDGIHCQNGEKQRPFCIASQCMAWRWRVRPDQAAMSDGTAIALGYCGLAGKP